MMSLQRSGTSEGFCVAEFVFVLQDSDIKGDFKNVVAVKMHKTGAAFVTWGEN